MLPQGKEANTENDHHSGKEDKESIESRELGIKSVLKLEQGVEQHNVNFVEVPKRVLLAEPHKEDLPSKGY